MDKKAFTKLTYGLYIVASEFEGKKAGYIANTVFQVTSTPPFLAISAHKSNYSTGIILESKLFSVSVLSNETPVSAIGRFGFTSGDDFDKFSGIEYGYPTGNIPVVLESALAWFTCNVTDVNDLGSHWLIIGKVTDCKLVSDAKPLTYETYREKYKMYSPQNSPTYIDPAEIVSSSVPDKAEIQTDDKPENYVCSVCGYLYNPLDGEPHNDIKEGTSFEELPDDYRCPLCNAGKDYFKKSN